MLAMEFANCSLVPHGSEAGLIIFQRVAYTPVFIVGLILNTLVLWRFTRIPKWTETHIFMLNLLLADLLLTLFLPFRIFETYCPIKPTRFCTFLISVHYINMYVSIFTITAISVHRYIAIRFPMHSKSGTGASEDRRKKITSGASKDITLLPCPAKEFTLLLCPNNNVALSPCPAEDISLLHCLDDDIAEDIAPPAGNAEEIALPTCTAEDIMFPACLPC
ncbi:hypothetical protein HF521_010167 [Silurus meridionalis]|uniref:G-protein coupled receptors family 1 profile domain-containing protein n=1 Tax=Silurus meridionalis TaxID=175797 RepID=A0A8T0ALG3_SILME|nr:hypothetical protein HF521_010167 [Silurus meridionalis]